MHPLLLNIKSNLQSKAMLYFVLIVAVLAFSVSAFAQTPVPLEIPTNDIFTQTNIWMGVFAPIVAIGIGIAVALAILTFIGKQIINAFH
jgi:hypothetical protein